jgi:hypothetical protein
MIYGRLIDRSATILQLALQFHPDKNGAPGADEAFKSKFPSSS